MIKTREELEANSELCNYCPLEEQRRGVHCYGGEPIYCWDSIYCEEAYKNYCNRGDDYEENE